MTYLLRHFAAFRGKRKRKKKKKEEKDARGRHMRCCA